MRRANAKKGKVGCVNESRGKALVHAALSKQDVETRENSFLTILKRQPFQVISNINTLRPSKPKIPKTDFKENEGSENNGINESIVIDADAQISMGLQEWETILGSFDTDPPSTQPLPFPSATSSSNTDSFAFKPTPSTSFNGDASNLLTPRRLVSSKPVKIIERIVDTCQTEDNQENNNLEIGQRVETNNKEGTYNDNDTNDNQESNNSAGSVTVQDTNDNQETNENDTFDVKENELITFLNTSSDGKSIISYYKNNSFRLNGLKRGLLADLIIRTELQSDPNKRLTSYDFKKFANAISEAFPREIVKTYYIPGNGRRKEKKAPGGKLYNKYTNITKKYIRDGIRSKIHEELEDEPVIVYNAEAINDDEYQTSVEWLNISISPWNIVIQKWKITAPRRLHEYEITKVPISDYVALFPALQLSEGSELIEIDFGVKYRDHKDCFHEAWPHLKDALITHAQRKIKDDPTFKAIIKANKIDFDVSNNDDRDILAVHCLLHLIPLGNPRKRTSEESASFRLSRTEVVNGFLLRVLTEGTLETAIAERTDNFLKQGERCQAFVVISGSKPPYTYIVVFNNTKHFFKDLGSAVDSCFKTFMVFDVQYPRAALQCWTFIQKFIYNISTSHDLPESASLSTLAADLDLV